MAEIFQNTPPIKEFPNGNWTIIWHGRITRNPQVPSEPLIEVGIRSKHGDRTIEIGVGQLPLLKIGSNWRDKRLTIYEPDQIENFILPKINITPDCIRIIEAWDKIEAGKYAIPPTIRDIPKEFASSSCLAIEYNQDPYGIIIPASEVARFYYCHSTDLAHSAFWGEYSYDLNDIVNYEKCGFDSELDRAIVHLRQRFSDIDAWTIGRILFDENAKHGVQEIHKSLLRNLDSNKSGFFECAIPFIGTTRWKAKGLQIGTKERPRYLILQLLKCSHPFPFSQLQVDRDNNSTKADSETDMEQEEKKTYDRNLNRNDEKEIDGQELNSEKETHKNLPIQNILIQSAQFDFLENKEIIKPESKEYNRYKSPPNKPKAPEADGLGTGQGNYGKDSTNQQAKINRSKGVGADLEMLQEAVKQLASDGMKIKIRRIDVVPLSEASTRRQWAYLESASKTRRSYIAVDIKHNGNHYCWIDIQQRRKNECTVGLIKSKKIIGDQTLDTIMKNLTRYKGVWDGTKGSVVSGLSLDFERVLHTWNSIDKLESVIIQKISV
ncbi:hypothetical protein THMIRHAS_07570 [Thiosulfatimonas sediminis]|uniref:TnsE C-terminal domain-containing protein n=1 Tax=Thiosulfatimonas sediminis TaxID=2675054 RepID=A0A6F8PTN7_9GAMM|nr:hypothetical protein [Thiosulfatimonas sediminis]BBP45384.1 hypothetical protein THMIRHAS_07570 [Thiosulfatimonas sediminis]